METSRGRPAVGIGFATVMILVAAAALIYLARAPTEQPPEHAVVPLADIEAVAFSHDPFDEVCRRYVDRSGLVDYEALAQDAERLDEYLAQVAEISPHGNLAAFPGEAEAVAYWLNAYNAWMMRAVLDAYPLESVQGIEPPVFEAETRVCGGETMSLNNIEHDILRKEFLEPRVHLALNCASMGCPWIPAEAFDPERLDDQLDRETRRFFAAESHLKLDADAGVVHLTPLLDWYGEDFIRWLKEVRSVEEPLILDYVKLYAPEEMAGQIDRDMEVRWQQYDWRLNDANAPWRVIRGTFQPREG